MRVATCKWPQCRQGEQLFHLEIGQRLPALFHALLRQNGEASPFEERGPGGRTSVLCAWPKGIYCRGMPGAVGSV